MHGKYVMALLVMAGLLMGVAAQAADPLVVLGDSSPLRFMVAYQPPGSSAEKRAWYRAVATGDECESPLPPADWMAADFDDRGWPPAVGNVLGGNYGFCYKGDVALLGVRAKFRVADPAAVKDLALALTFRGGVVAFLNGREVGRSHLPDGPLPPWAGATAYPEDALTAPAPDPRAPKPAAIALLERRARQATFAIPATALRRGVNVLALELHWSSNRAPKGDWNTTGLLALHLTAATGSAVTPNAGGARVWVADPLLRVGQDAEYGDPAEPLGPLTFDAPRNGFASGQVVITARADIPAPTVKVSDLRGPDVIPAAAVRVRYAQVAAVRGFVPLLDAPSTAPDAQRPPWQPKDRRDTTPRPVEGPRFLPIWFTVTVPADAATGDYAGSVTISGYGGDPVSVPIRLHVYGWTLPAPRDWRTAVNVLQSPESVAGHYGVPLWSDEHFRLMEPSLRAMGEIGNDLLGVSAVAKTVFGNDPLIVFRGERGGYVPDFRYLERYLKLYGKCAGAPQFLSVQVWHYGMSQRGYGRDGGSAASIAETIPVMVLKDDGTLASAELPMFGKPGTEATWRAVMEGVRDRVAALGWKDTHILAGTAGDNHPNKEIIAFFKQVAPFAEWRIITHNSLRWGADPAQRTTGDGMVIGYYDSARRLAFTQPTVPGHPRGTSARDSVGTDPLCYRSLTPVNIVGARYEGFGWKGLDYWPYTDAEGRQRTALNTYVQFGNVVGSTPRSMLLPGLGGAVHTQQFEALRMGVQEGEAIWALRAILNDPVRRAKIGEPLALQAEALIEETSEVYELGARMGPHGAVDIRALVRRLFTMTEAVVAAAR
jgi:hypothetical protein